jgi:hypothetical protein
MESRVFLCEMGRDVFSFNDHRLTDWAFRIAFE